MAQSDRLYNLSVLASLAQMTSEMNLNNNQRKLKQAEQDSANKKWEREFAYKKEQDQWQKDIKLQELNLTEQELFAEHGGALSNEDKQAIDSALKDAKLALESDDITKMNAAQETLQAVAYKVSEAMYAAQQAQEQEQQPPAQHNDDDIIIDAEAV